MSWVIRRLPRALSILRKSSADEACYSKYLHSLCKPHTNKSSSSLFTRPLLFQLRVRFSTAAEETLWNEKHANDGPVVTADDDGAESSFIPVKAYLLGTGVDLKGIQPECSLDGSPFEAVPPNSRSTNYVIFKSIDEFHNYNPVAKFGAESKDEKWSDNHYMVVFQYGSVVFFNFKDQEELEQKCIQIVRKFASGLLTEIRKDDYGILEKPSLDKWMKDGSDYIVLKRFDIDCIRTIGSVLGQSIALDHFVRQVDVMVAEFTDLNRGMEKTGTFTMKRKKLFQLVGKANSNLADVILKLGLFERSDVAWKNARYAQIWEYLRDEYELTQRFGSLDYKLKFVEHNVRYFLEILQNRKSDFLEWLIIILISAEIMIGLYEIAHNTGMAS